jgi:hypothetical protein
LKDFGEIQVTSTEESKPQQEMVTHAKLGRSNSHKYIHSTPLNIHTMALKRTIAETRE